jgi:hypothetical protein
MGITIKQVYARDILNLAQLLVGTACTSSTQLTSASSTPRAELPNLIADPQVYLEKND